LSGGTGWLHELSLGRWSVGGSFVAAVSLQNDCFALLRSYGWATVERPFSRKRRSVIRAGAENGSEKPTVRRRVGLKPGLDWHKRNFLTEVLIPSLFTKRSGSRANPLFPKVKPGEICITWIGHASFLIQLSGMNVLIDPNWSMWLSVIKRLKRPGLHIDNLPSIDTVLVTHAHFDHLDRRTLRRVAADQPIVVPTGVGNLVHDLGFNIVHELDEWQGVRLGPLKVSLTPCHHWGARMLHDQHRGFGGFVIEGNDRSIFHCGDSAYFQGFREIGKRFPIEIALLPIGAYDAQSKREVHMNPEEAVRAFLELGGRMLVPMHYGTFRLGFEPLNEPPQRLLSSARENGVEDKVLLMTEGRPVVL